MQSLIWFQNSYHVDMVPFRLLVTYAGMNCNEAADRDAFLNGKPNNNIVKDKNAINLNKRFFVEVMKEYYTGPLILH